MIIFFRTTNQNVIAVQSNHEFSTEEIERLNWLFDGATLETEDKLKGFFVGPRSEMISPWSTNAVEITQNMGLIGIERMEEYFPVKDAKAEYDPMLQEMYEGLNQSIFTIHREPEPIFHVEDLDKYNQEEGLALSEEEIDYLRELEKELGRKLTDSEVFGFAQINS